jgi:nucleoside-diphosphate-sugar epimerase
LERVLVTGSHGFLGERLVQKLESQGQQVFRGDRMGNCSERVDHVFDLAAYGNLASQDKQPAVIFNANQERLFRLLSNADFYEYRSFVVVSSNAVLLPRKTFYSGSKMAAEGLAQAWAHEFHKPVVIVRPFSVTGVGEQPGHLIPTLIRSCLYGEEMPFVPGPVHDFIDVEDVVSAFIIASQNAQDHLGGVFNAGTGKQYTNEQVKNIVELVTGKKAKLKYVDQMRSFDTDKWVADNASLKELGWKPTKELGESIAEMVVYERANTGN